MYRWTPGRVVSTSMRMPVSGPTAQAAVTQTAVTDDIALIVAAAIGQRGEIRADVQPQRLFFGEVHRGALDRQLAPGGDAGGVGLEVKSASTVTRWPSALPLAWPFRLK